MDLKLGAILVFGAYLCSSNALPPGMACVCTRNFKPVCGSNGVTYSNQCLLNCERVSSKSELTIAKQGPCDAPETCVCPFNYLPVCGSDFVTYSNECSLKCKQKGNSWLRLSYQGECKTPEQPPCTCQRKMEPVCGSDGITYNNDCLLNCATINNPMLSIKSFGPCDDKVIVVKPNDEGISTPEQPPCTCQRKMEPVCGSDGNTYNNDCLLNCATINNPMLSIKSFGPCDDKVIVVKPNDEDISTPEQPPCTCQREMEPVCGSDGNTYNNDCLLNCATINNPMLSIKSFGPCDDKVIVVKPTDEDISTPEQPPCTCPRTSKPVCGSDGNTYINDCLLNCATINNPMLSIKSFGPCDDKVIVVKPTDEDISTPEQPPCTCPRTSKPVCGSNGNTYINDCLLNCATINNPMLSIKSFGPCEDNDESSPEDEDDYEIHPSLVRSDKKKDSE